MSRQVRVSISEYRVQRSPAVLISYGLGSCLGIAIYDAHIHFGGLAHTLLPQGRDGQSAQRPGKFVDSAIETMVQELLNGGAARERLEAKICGGASMFSPGDMDQKRAIGARNAQAARDTLERLAIPLVAEDVGGSHGRTVEFDLATGQLLVRSVRGRDKIKLL